MRYSSVTRDRSSASPGIASSEGVLGFGHGTDVDPANRAWLSQDLLRYRQGGYDLFLFGAAGGEDTSNRMHLSHEVNLLASLEA